MRNKAMISLWHLTLWQHVSCIWMGWDALSIKSLQLYPFSQWHMAGSGNVRPSPTPAHHSLVCIVIPILRTPTHKHTHTHRDSMWQTRPLSIHNNASVPSEQLHSSCSPHLRIKFVLISLLRQISAYACVYKSIQTFMQWSTWREKSAEKNMKNRVCHWVVT